MDTTKTKLQQLTEWPSDAEGMTVDLMLRVIGADTQRAWNDKWDAINAGEPMASQVMMARTFHIVSAVGLMGCILALRAVDPIAAEKFVRDYWLMCDSGDTFGELLWEYTEQAGLNPDLVRAVKEP